MDCIVSRSPSLLALTGHSALKISKVGINELIPCHSSTLSTPDKKTKTRQENKKKPQNQTQDISNPQRTSNKSKTMPSGNPHLPFLSVKKAQSRKNAGPSKLDEWCTDIPRSLLPPPTVLTPAFHARLPACCHPHRSTLSTGTYTAGAARTRRRTHTPATQASADTAPSRPRPHPNTGSAASDNPPGTHWSQASKALA